MKRCAGALILVVSLIVGTGWACGQQAEKANPSSAQETGGQAVVPPTAKDLGTPKLQRRNPRYQLTDGDIIDLGFPLTPEFNQTVTVAPDGYITLLAVGDLHVEGLTLPQLRQSLQKAYSKVLHQPIISTTLKDFNKPYFVVGGQVGKPGKYDLRGDTSVLEALQIAGGITDSAKHSQVLLFRRVSNDWVEVHKINVKQMLRGKDLAEDIELQPGDMLLVPKNTLSKIERFIPVPNLAAYVNPF
jgi:polysaccharide biosynthesis/export protein